jgi:hypothetical protein
VTEQHLKHRRSQNEAPRDFTRDVIYFFCGAFVGVILAARAVLGLSAPDGLQISFIGVGGLALGYASARWGDPVWMWLGKWLRWLI